jgi:hypothetical protein
LSAAKFANHPEVLVACSADDLPIEAAADDPGDVFERHALLGDGVISASRGLLSSTRRR